MDTDNRLLAALAREDLGLLTPHLKDVAYDLGVLLQEAGDPVDFVYFPRTGMISVLAVMEDGDAVEAVMVGREGAVGVQTGFGSRTASGRAVVQIKGISSRIGAAPFRGAMEQSATLRDLVIRYTDVQMGLVLQSTGCNALHPVENRLCRWLLQTHDRGDGDTLTLTQEFLSEMLGVQRTTVTLLAGQLQDLGLLRYRRGQIEIIDRPGLERKACACYAAARLRSETVFS